MAYQAYRRYGRNYGSGNRSGRRSGGSGRRRRQGDGLARMRQNAQKVVVLVLSPGFWFACAVGAVAAVVGFVVYVFKEGSVRTATDTVYEITDGETDQEKAARWKVWRVTAVVPFVGIFEFYVGYPLNWKAWYAFDVSAWTQMAGEVKSGHVVSVAAVLTMSAAFWYDWRADASSDV